MRKTIVSLFFIVLSIQMVSSQIEGKWITSYSYDLQGQDKFDMSKKRFVFEDIYVFEKDSLYRILFNKYSSSIKKIAYQFKNDSIYTKSFSFKCLLDKDTLQLIDNEYEGFYKVSYRLKKPQGIYKLDSIKSYLINNKFITDFSTFALKSSNLDSMPGTLIFDKEDKLTIKINTSIETGPWHLIAVEEHIYLVIDALLPLQLYHLDDDKIIFKGYYEYPHNVIFKRIKTP